MSQSKLGDAKFMRDVRLNMWLDQILKNIEDIEAVISDEDIDYDKIRIEILHQYRLIDIMRRVLDGKVILMGLKVKSTNT